MQLSEADFGGALPIDGYGPGFFRVAGAVIRGGIVVGPGGCAPWGGFGDRAALAPLAGQVDVVFVGTGADMARLPEDLRDWFEAAGIGAEPMGTGPAARTYNVLASEGRRVAAALVPV